MTSKKRKQQQALLVDYDAAVVKANNWRHQTIAEVDECHVKLVAIAWNEFQMELAKTNQKE